MSAPFETDRAYKMDGWCNTCVRRRMMRRLELGKALDRVWLYRGHCEVCSAVIFRFIARKIVKDERK
jgi:hypothetical protein